MRSHNRYIFLHAHRNLRINLKFINVFIFKLENKLIYYIIFFKFGASLDIYVFFYIRKDFKKAFLFSYANEFLM